MGFLTDYESNYVLYLGEKIPVNPAYDSILSISRMYRTDQILTEGEKIETALDILVEEDKMIRKLSISQKAELLSLIFQKFVNGKERTGKAAKQPLFDFEEDGEYIYASFMKDYGIDLLECRGKLSFRRFLALFSGLSGHTKMKEVMRVRDMEIPAPTQSNQKERNHLMELKAYYALPVKGAKGQDGLNLLFGTLERMAP